jgi:hypothetical protein
MLLAMGTYLLINHNPTPTIISAMTMFSKGINSSPQILQVSMKNTQSVGDYKDQQNGPQADAGASAIAPAAVAVVTASASENQQQNNQ